jgi:tetratricopeptide (TPR) repeat protein
MKKILTLLCFSALLALEVPAQSISLPPSGDNQKSIVTQYIGSLANVSVKYNSPDVTGPNGEDRKGQIWGQLVPYGLNVVNFGLGNPSPWRVGANENTVIKFSHDVLIEGMPLKAGKYGLHLIVEETGPWTWIFSKNYSAWGSYFYEESDDALRVQVDPADHPYTEWLTFDFVERDPSSTTLAMKWENKMVPLHIELDNMADLYVSKFKQELQGSAGFNHQNLVAASQYCVQNDTHLEDALVWADQAINAPFIGVKNFSTMQNKASVLMKLGKMEEAEALMTEAMHHPATTAFEIHTFGRQLIARDKKDKALEVFKYNHDRFKGAWPTNVGMARGLSAMGMYGEALKYAEMAYEEAPDQLNKDSMKAAVEKLKDRQDIN